MSHQLHWKLGGWLGTQIGGTVWILLAAILAGLHNLATGGWLLAVFAAPNLLGVVLWRRRQRIPCYPAMQTLIFAIGCSSLLAVFLLDRSGQWVAMQSGPVLSSSAAYWAIMLAVSALMIQFYFRFGRGGASG